mgnify:CR=1 FL=1
MFVQVYVVQSSSELGEARGCWGGGGGGGGAGGGGGGGRGRACPSSGGAKQACPCLSDKLGQARGGAKQACLTSLFMLV